MKRSFFLFAIALMIAFLPQACLPAEPIQLKFAIVVGADTPSGLAIQKVINLIDKRLKEKVAVSFFPKGGLGTEAQVFKKMENGEHIINFVSTPQMNGLDPTIRLFDLPYAFSNYSQVDKAINGAIGEELSKRLLAKGWRVLGWWNIGFSTISTKKDSLKTFEDFNGLRIRVLESPVMIDTMKTLGMKPLPLSFKEIPKAMQMFQLDGITVASLANEYPFHDLIKSIYFGSLYYYPRCIVIKESLWKQLPPDIQSGIREAIREVTPWQWAKSRTMEAVYEKKLKDLGIAVVRFSPEEEKKAKMRLQPIWAKYAHAIGQDLVEKLQGGN